MKTKLEEMVEKLRNCKIATIRHIHHGYEIKNIGQSKHCAITDYVWLPTHTILSNVYHIIEQESIFYE